MSYWITCKSAMPKHIIIRLLTVVTMLLSTSVTLASDVPQLFLGRNIHPEAHEQVHLWGQLLGDWQIEWEAFDEQGAVRNQGEATWHWYSTLGGMAIQDFYTHPRPTGKLGARVGTNLRVFEPEKGEWHIRWSHNYGQGYESFTAIRDGDGFIMFEVGKETSSRIRFFEFSEQRFRQQEEKSDDGGKTWRVSFAAAATRID